LNANGLFSLHDDAVTFLAALMELENLYPGNTIDGFEFRVLHIYNTASFQKIIGCGGIGIECGPHAAAHDEFAQNDGPLARGRRFFICSFL
jgi:hypothetical protein